MQCDLRGCPNYLCLWSVSNTNDSAPKYDSFTVCDRDLANLPKFRDIFKALVYKRYDGGGDLTTVCYGDWMLQKKIETWSEPKRFACSVCASTEKLWAYHQTTTIKYDLRGYPHGKSSYLLRHFCDSHLPRDRIGPVAVDMFCNKPANGICPVESTWFEKDLSMKIKAKDTLKQSQQSIQRVSALIRKKGNKRVSFASPYTHRILG